MSRLQWSLLVVLALVVALVAVLVARNRQAPVLPGDDDHATFVNATACLECHGGADGLARSKNHPIGDDCLRCHGRR
jgi:cytochrome c553